MEPITSVVVAPTADRKTAPSSFGATLRAAAAGAAEGLSAAAGLLAPIAPAGMVLAGAVRGVAQSAAAGARGAASAAPPAAGGAGSGDSFEAARLLQQEGQSFNLRYLELQERLQRETREFTALSNVMKVRHDAARAAIQNVQ
jgi:parvulin-like peptidyl-prolyl isomerase